MHFNCDENFLCREILVILSNDIFFFFFFFFFFFIFRFLSSVIVVKNSSRHVKITADYQWPLKNALVVLL